MQKKSHPASAAMTAFVSHPVCFGHNMGEGHPESPDRLSAIHDRLTAAQLADFLSEIRANEVTDEQLLRVHPQSYLDYLQSVSPHIGTFRVDTDTAMNSGTLAAARFAAGAVITAVDEVMSGSAANAFCAIRPPGHHASAETAMGFCFFNNAAVGAAHAMAVYGLERIAIADFDVHHGNGTESVFQNDSRVMLLSSFQHPFFPYSGDKPAGSNPNIINTPLPSGSRGDAVLKVVDDIWLPALHRFRPQMILVSAGFDAHLEDDMGNFGLVEADFAAITERLVAVAEAYCPGKIVSVLEGGYDPSSLGRSVAAHIKVLADL